MLAQIVLVQQDLLHGAVAGVEHQGVVVHKGDLLHDHRIVDGVLRVSTPGEHAVAVDQHAGDGHGVLALEGLDDHVARLQLILPVDLLLGHLTGAGDLAVEIVPVGGAHGRNAHARLGEAGGPAAVGVDHAPQIGEGPVQGQVGGGVGGGLIAALHPLAGLQVQHHHVLGGHGVILHAGGLDDHQTLLPVDAGDVAPGEGDQVILGQ